MCSKKKILLVLVTIFSQIVVVSLKLSNFARRNSVFLNKIKLESYLNSGKQ